MAGAPPGPICAPHPKEVCGGEIEHQMNPEHDRLLASKWLSPKVLGMLAEREGLKYKKGRFSLSEQRSIQSALDAYKTVSFYQCTQYFVSLFASADLEDDFRYSRDALPEVRQNSRRDILV